MRTPAGIVLLAIAICVSSDPRAYAQGDPPADESAVALLDSLLDAVWDFELTESPMLATNVGDPRGQDRLADVSLKAIRRRAAKRQAFLERLLAIRPDRLPSSKQIDHELLRLRLERQSADFRLKTHLMPINNRRDFISAFPNSRVK